MQFNITTFAFLWVYMNQKIKLINLILEINDDEKIMLKIVECIEEFTLCCIKQLLKIIFSYRKNENNKSSTCPGIWYNMYIFIIYVSVIKHILQYQQFIKIRLYIYIQASFDMDR